MFEKIKTTGFLYFVFMILCTSTALFAQSQAEKMLEKGNEYYQNNKYEKAADTYRKIISSGYQGTSLYYNLGNTYYREGKLGLSILYYEKALKLSPGDEDVLHNLKMANAKTMDKIETLPKFFLFQWWESLLALFTLSGWTYLAYIFYVILLVFLAFYFLLRKPKYQRYSFFAALISGALLAVTVVLLVVNLNRAVNIKYGIVVEPSVTVHLAPDNKSSDAFVIHEGLKVRLEDKVDNWVKIRLHDGKIGWMQNKSLRII